MLFTNFFLLKPYDNSKRIKYHNLTHSHISMCQKGVSLVKRGEANSIPNVRKKNWE